MICLRTWQATEMDGKGNDSLGTFFLTMKSNVSDSIPYVGVSFYFVIGNSLELPMWFLVTFLKGGEGLCTYTLAHHMRSSVTYGSS